MSHNICEKYELGDIVFVSKTNDGNVGTEKHLFVIINNGETADTAEVVPAEYFGLIVSSHIEKSKENSHFKYNEPLNKNDSNNLNNDSIVKCDEIYSIPPENILFKIGSVDVDDFMRFMASMKSAMESK